MILREYSSNQPGLVIPYPLLIGLATIPLIMNGFELEIASNFRADSMLSVQGISWLPLVFSSICILAGAIYANRVFNRHEFHDSPTYVPGLLYTLIATGCMLLQFSPSILLANLFLLAGLDPLLGVFRQGRVLSQYFKAGIWIGLASLIYPPYIATLPALWVSILFTRAFHWREHLVCLLGFSVPFLYWISLNYYDGNLSSIVMFHKIIGQNPGINWMKSGWINQVFSISIIISLLAALPAYLFFSQRNNNKSRNVKAVFFIITLGLLSSILVSYLFSGMWLVSGVILPVSFISGYWFTNYRYSLIAPFVFYFMLGACILLGFHFSGIIP